MAVTDCYLVSGGASGEVNGTGPNKIQTGYQLRYFVKCDSPLDTVTTVIEHFRRASNVPFIGDIYEAGNDRDSNAICRTLRPSLIDRSGGMFHVDVVYEPKDGGGGKEEKPDKNDPGKTTDNPLDWLDEITTSGANRSVPVWAGVYQGTNPPDILNPKLEVGAKRMPCNSALVGLVPGLEMELASEVIRITQQKLKYDATAGDWRNKVNSDSFTITKPFYEFTREFKPYTVKVAAINQDFRMTNDFPHWRRTTELHVSSLPHGWRDEVPDMGRQMLKTSGARLPNGTTLSFVAPAEECLIEITGPDGVSLSEPVPLDGMGGVALPTKPQVYLIWSKYEEKSFSGLSFL